MGIVGRVEYPVKRFIGSLLSDKKLSKDVLYRKYISSDFDATLGHNVVKYVDHRARAVKLAHTQESKALSTSGEVQVGDIAFVFVASELPVGISLKDQVICPRLNGEIVNVKAIDEIFEIATIVTVAVGGSND